MIAKKLTSKRPLSCWLLTLALISAVPFGLLGSAALAVGLGSITLHSRLGAPLDAQIMLTDVSVKSIDTVIVSLADNAAYQRAGLYRHSLLNDIKLEVATNIANEPVVKLSSIKPITEPFLTIIIELAWPAGKLIREFTLLLDPVVHVNKGSLNNDSGNSGVDQTVPESQANGQYWLVVKPGDNLYEIARSVAPPNIHVDQAAIAIYRANADAFFGSIDQLKAGAEILIPNVSTMILLSPHRAKLAIQSSRIEYTKPDAGNNSPLSVAETSVVETNNPANSLQSHHTELVALVKPQRNLPNIKEEALLETAQNKESNSVQIAANQLNKVGDQTTAATAIATASRSSIKESGRGDGNSFIELRHIIADLSAAMIQLRGSLDQKSEQLATLSITVDKLVERQQAAPTRDNLQALASVATALKTPVSNRTIGESTDVVDSSATYTLAESPEPNIATPEPITQSKIKSSLIVVKRNSSSMLKWFFAGAQNRSIFELIRDIGLISLALLLSYIVASKLWMRRTLSLANTQTDIAYVDNNSADYELQVAKERAPSENFDPLSAIEYFRQQLTSEQRKEEALRDVLLSEPENQKARMDLLQLYFDRKAVELFESTAREMYQMTGGKDVRWHKVIELGLELNNDMQFYIDPHETNFEGDQFDFDDLNVPIIDKSIASVPGGTDGGDREKTTTEWQQMASACSDKSDTAPLDQSISSLKTEEDFRLHEIDIELDMENMQLPSEEMKEAIGEDELSALTSALSASDADTEDHGTTGPNSVTEIYKGHDVIEEAADFMQQHSEPVAVNMSVWKEAEIKLDLAVVYKDLGNADGAKILLNEVLETGDSTQRQVAKALLAKLH